MKERRETNKKERKGGIFGPSPGFAHLVSTIKEASVQSSADVSVKLRQSGSLCSQATSYMHVLVV